MILAEQNHEVEKWTTTDPIYELRHGEALWKWINHRKTLYARHAADVAKLEAGIFDVVIDNFRADTWTRWAVDPSVEADRLNVCWVSLRADDDGRSFDVIAQTRAWGDLGVMPFYLGDTAAGLWVAFKALAAPKGHHVIRQATCLAKLVEGELIVPREPSDWVPWDEPGSYQFNKTTRNAEVLFKGVRQTEPTRDARWRFHNLHHVGGRFVI
jgi:hypothetical protein